MFQTQLTSNLIPEKIVIALVPVCVFFSFGAMPVIITILVALLMLMLVPYSIYTIYMAHLNITFDASFAFITDRKTERIIPLKSIKSITPVSNFALRKRWQIVYNANGMEEELFFYPKEGSASLISFMKAVRAQNPMAHCADVN